MTFQLPELPYAFDALEPVVDAQTMELHYGKHHEGYTTKLNKALEDTDLKNEPIETILASLDSLPAKKQSDVRNNGGGYYNHSLFWQIMAPESSHESIDSQSQLQSSINSTFGSLQKFKEKFEQAALGQFGSGWAWLCSNKDGELQICSTPNQDNPLMDLKSKGNVGSPILGLDVWEHAYYLKYQNKRADYVKAWWSIVNWTRVAENLELAMQDKSLID